MNNQDLISRKALPAEYCNGCDALAKKMCDQDICGVAMMINDAPAVDAVEVVHGEWVVAERNKAQRTLVVECSDCGAVFDLPMFSFGLNYNFCPNCGADMGERKGDEK